MGAVKVRLGVLLRLVIPHQAAFKLVSSAYEVLGDEGFGSDHICC